MRKITQVLSEDKIISLARESKFCERKSKLTAMMFLKMLLFDHLISDQPSLQQHCFGLHESDEIKITKQALDKRFDDTAVGFIKTLFQNYLKEKLALDKLPSIFKEKFKAIRIMDSTEFKLPASLSESFPGFEGDGTKACAQIQFEFDILTGKIEYLSLENARLSDATYANERLDSLKAGELVIRDLGYYTLNSYKLIESKGVYFISRLKPYVTIYERYQDGWIELSYQSIIKRLKQSGKKYLDIEVLIGKDSKQPVRLIASLLNEQAIAKRLKTKKYREAGKELSQLNLFVSNIPCELLSGDDVYLLYKIRWQIELIFKTWKSILNIDTIRKMKVNRFKCYLYSKLLWILINWEICICLGSCIWKECGYFVSIYKCFALIKLQINKIKCILFGQADQLYLWLQSLYVMFIDYGLKENKKGRISLIDLLAMQND